MSVSWNSASVVLISAFLLAACVPQRAATGNPVYGEKAQQEVPGLTADPPFIFDPVLPFDAIPPIYDPIFQTASEIGYSDEELVIGVVKGGEAKAYSITVLRSRELVNDELAGLPILVTW